MCDKERIKQLEKKYQIDMKGKPRDPKALIDFASENEYRTEDDNITAIVIAKHFLIVPEEIRMFKKLKILVLSADEIPDWIGELSDLTSLTLRDFHKLTPQIISLPKLKEFYLMNFDILPSYLQRLTNLTKLSLGLTEKSEFPEWLGNLQNLTELDISYQGIKMTQLSPLIGHAIQIEKLQLWGYFLKFPTEIGNLKKLKIWFIKGSIDVYPECIGQMENLEVLSIEGPIRCGTLPDNFGRLSKLLQFEGDGTCLKRLPESFGNLSAIKWIRLEGNDFQNWPECICRLKTLEILSLDECNLSFISSTICNLISLQKLSLDRNQISEIPDCLGYMNKLYEFYILENKIRRLPPSFLRPNAPEICALGNPLDVESEKWNHYTSIN